MSKVELVAKLSAKSMGIQPKKNSIKEGESKRLGLVFGRVAKYEITPNQYGESTKFKGSFEGQNLETGVVYKSSTAFLPGLIEGMIMEAVDAGDGVLVDFAIAIGVKFSNTPMGYEYTVEPLTDVRESDELASLRQLALQALPAPAAEHSDAAGETASKGKKK